MPVPQLSGDSTGGLESLESDGVDVLMGGKLWDRKA